MAKSRFYITTATQHIKGRPELEDVQDQLFGDIVGRYLRQQGKDVRLQVGTNELGTGVMSAAKRENLNPIEYVEREYPAYVELAAKMDINYTDFIRTASQYHHEATQYIWRKLSPYLYLREYEGWHTDGEDALVNDKTASQHSGVSPVTGKPYERITEQNYFFKLSGFTPKIREAIESGEVKIEPEERKNEVIAMINEGVEDISFSRSAALHSWGVPVPDNPTQTIYVSISALASYLSAIGYPDRADDWQSSWPADIQVAGRDTIRFHGIIWLGILIALDLPLPKQIVFRGNITSGGVKMSEEANNIIDPRELIDTYGTDAFRYYIARHTDTLLDGDITKERFETVYNTELANELGNLVHRVASMIEQYQSGVLGEIKHGEHDIQLYRNAMKEFNFNEALERVWSKIRSVNYYIDTVKPWEIAARKETDQEAADDVVNILRNCTGSILQIADLLVPFMPATARRIHEIFSAEMISSDNTNLFPRIYKYTEDTRVDKGE